MEPPKKESFSMKLKRIMEGAPPISPPESPASSTSSPRTGPTFRTGGVTSRPSSRPSPRFPSPFADEFERDYRDWNVTVHQDFDSRNTKISLEGRNVGIGGSKAEFPEHFLEMVKSDPNLLMRSMNFHVEPLGGMGVEYDFTVPMTRREDTARMLLSLALAFDESVLHEECPEWE